MFRNSPIEFLAINNNRLALVQSEREAYILLIESLKSVKKGRGTLGNEGMRAWRFMAALTAKCPHKFPTEKKARWRYSVSFILIEQLNFTAEKNAALNYHIYSMIICKPITLFI